MEHNTRNTVRYSEDVLIYSNNSKVFGRVVSVLIKHVQLEEHLANTTKVYASGCHRAKRVFCKGIHIELSAKHLLLWKGRFREEVDVILERFESTQTQGPRRTREEGVLAVKRHAQSEKAVPRVILGNLAGRLNDEKKFFDWIIEIQIENRSSQILYQIERGVLTLCNDIVELVRLEPLNFRC